MLRDLAEKLRHNQTRHFVKEKVGVVACWPAALAARTKQKGIKIRARLCLFGLCHLPDVQSFTRTPIFILSCVVEAVAAQWTCHVLAFVRYSRCSCALIRLYSNHVILKRPDLHWTPINPLVEIKRPLPSRSSVGHSSPGRPSKAPALHKTVLQ